jgi:hypothetical protein
MSKKMENGKWETCCLKKILFIKGKNRSGGSMSKKMENENEKLAV